jgi:hypothetical protein
MFSSASVRPRLSVVCCCCRLANSAAAWQTRLLVEETILALTFTRRSTDIGWSRWREWVVCAKRASVASPTARMMTYS